MENISNNLNEHLEEEIIMAVFKILVINPGSTSTKVSIYENELELFKKNIVHSTNELINYKLATDQFAFRHQTVMSFLEELQFNIRELDAIVARGGALPPLEAGAYRINQSMVDFLKQRPRADHASNIAAIIALEMSRELGIPSFIYDAISVDQLIDVARISGSPEIPRLSITHALNSRSMAQKYALSIDMPYAKITIITAHLGGGITLAVHHQGRIIDMISDDEGPFSPERAGKVPCVPLVDLCYSGKYDHSTTQKLFRGKGGLIAYLGTNNASEVEERIAQGDQEALLIYEAMAYQIAKGIGELATVVKGKLDGIILTGGVANSEMLTRWIIERVKFIAPVVIMPGENEMEALALGTLRVLRQEETAHEYDFPV